MSQVRYHPLGPLLSGEGSRAFLGLALEESVTPRPVVLVWAPPDVTRDTDLLSQLRRETQRASVLEHPNILRVHDLVKLETGIARVTEFADGESLRRVLEVRPRIPPALAALIVADVAMGIHYAHLAGNDDGTPMVHGDLRPETVMVSFSGVCKVTGYGALNVAPRERNGRRVRNRRNYSAPEQLMGGRDAITPRTDVFLLGTLLYECLSGRMPYQDAPDADQAVLTRALPALPGDVPRSLAEVVRLATAKRANERYPNALEFREALVSSVEGNLPSAELFAEFLTQLFPPDRDARATRRQMLEIGLADAQRRPSLGNLPVVLARLSGSTPRVPTADIVPEMLEALDVSFEEQDAAAVDSVLEVTGRHARPGIARPLERDEPSLPSSFVEPNLDPADVAALKAAKAAKVAKAAKAVTEESPPPKRRSRAPLLAGALAATAALAAGGFFIWKGQQPLPVVAVATPPPAPPAARPAPAPDPAVEPAPTPTPAEGTVALASPPPSSPDAPATPPTTPPEPSPEPTPGTPTTGAPATGIAATGTPTTGTPTTGTPTTGMVVPAVALADKDDLPETAVVQTSGALPAAAPTPDSPAPAAAPVQVAVDTRLQLTVMPPVDVLLDGKRLGRTPLTVPLAPGPYTLELRNPLKGVRTTRAITVLPHGMTKQRVLLSKGSVQVKAPSGARIFLDGRKAGPKLSLYEGDHQLVVTHGKTRWEKAIRLEARQKMTVDMSREQP